ncbi:hypothetical protein F5883DRAFT_526186 [Diaporthe sp. PMI_573]|nr:hypothetical protein F5883DRAFT_526186 [Diaporthaceae sp. PMI_573]
MARVYIMPTHQSPGWLIPTICVVYGLLAIFTAFLVTKNISDFRDKALRRLPARFEDHAFIRGTLTALIIIVPSLLWPMIMAVTLPIIAALWLLAEIRKCRERRLARRQTERAPDLERGVLNPDNGEHRENGIDEGRQMGEPSIPMVQITEPPPAYTPYPSVLATLQTQWLQTSDRNAERHIVHLNTRRIPWRTPEEMLGSASRVTMIPPR